MSFSPVQKLSVGTGIALAVLAIVGLTTFLGIRQMIGSEQAVANTNAAIAKLDRVVTRTLDAENAQRGYISTGAESFLEGLDEAQNDVEYALDSLRTLTEDDPEQRRNLDQLGPLISVRFRDVRAAVATRRRAGRDAAEKLLSSETAVRSRGGAGPIASRMRDEEMRVLGDRMRTMTTTGRSARRLILIGTLFSLVLALIAVQPARPSVARRLTERMSRALLLSPELQITQAESARHAGDRLRRLEQIVHALQVPLSAEEVAQLLLQKGAPPLVASLGVVVQRRGDGYLVLRSLGDAVPGLRDGAMLAADLVAPIAQAEQAAEPVVIESATERAKLFPSLGSFSGTGTSDGAFVAAPLTASDGVHGVLLLAFAAQRTFGDDERAYLATLGRLGGLALARVGS
ncbi:MAG: CHASE3 domain-containing protein [Gemmatimonadetes bacterium]|nr:CHASE3 domain-containing protein [Gemmatimonadota bacterium]MBI3569287.1 CHASE3 domain-containing protein [Gemmatimonadota bacterium]